jgi:hypothetical protein
MGNTVTVGDSARPPDPKTSIWSRVRGAVADLFPVPEPRRTSRGRMIAWYLAGFAAAVGYLLVIPAGRSRFDHVWAEDGARFLYDANTIPLWRVLTEPYVDSGYLHTIPRLGAELASQLPLSWAAATIAITAAMLRAGVALVVFTTSGGVLRSRTLRVALAALVVVAPVGNAEAINNLTNFHWFAFFGAFWLLWWRPAARWQVALATVGLFLAVTSSALVVTLAPLALVRFALPGWRQRIITLGYFLGLVIQGTTMLRTPRIDHFNMPVDLKAAAMGALSRVPLVTFTGSEDIGRYYQHFGYWPFVGALAVILALALVAFRWGGAPRAALVAVALAYAVLAIWLSLSQNWHWSAELLQPGVVLDGQRYSVVPCLMLLAVLAIGLDRIPKAGWRRAGMAVMAVVLLTGIVRQLPMSTGRLTGVPTWEQSVLTAKLECARGASEGVLQLEPTAPANWTFDLPCRYVN